MLPADLQKRTMTGVVLGGSVFLLVLLARVLPVVEFSLGVLSILVVATAAYEFVKALRLTIIVSVAIIVSLFLPTFLVVFLPIDHAAAGLVGLCLAVLVLCIIVRSNLDAASLGADLLVGVSLIGFGGSAIAVLISQPFMLIFVLSVVVANDIAAFFGGSALGGIRLAPALSPNKTVSGSLSGLLAGGGIGFLLGPLLLSQSYSLPLLGTALFVAAAAQLGDLLKSLVKRRAGIKDFGAVLPGHGGVLDRIDATLAGSLAFSLLFSATHHGL